MAGFRRTCPIDVAREMGVDILIVVDCGFPLLERGKLDSVATVSNQMLAILIRHNTAEQRKTLKASDVLIDPALGDFSSLDFSQHAQGHAPRRGGGARAAAAPGRAVGAGRRVPAHRRGARRARAAACRSIDFLRVEPGSERYAGAIDALFGDQVGKPVEPDAARARVSELYGQGNLEIFDYRLVQNRRRPTTGEPSPATAWR